MTANLRRLVKNCGDALNTPSFCMCGKQITKKKHLKTECLRREGYI